MPHLIRSFAVDDYPAVYALWQATPGIGLSAADSRPAVAAFLERNAGMSAVATVDARVVGAVLCGHDGRRGYVHHLAVSEEYRGRGIGRDLVGWCLHRLAEAGIDKCNAFLFRSNESGASFWTHMGWNERSDLKLLQKPL
jgi:putative acetyltransferase